MAEDGVFLKASLQKEMSWRREVEDLSLLKIIDCEGSKKRLALSLRMFS